MAENRRVQPASGNSKVHFLKKIQKILLHTTSKLLIPWSLLNIVFVDQADLDQHDSADFEYLISFLQLAVFFIGNHLNISPH